jgi:hypothetical protein
VYAVDEDYIVKPGPDGKPVRIAGSHMPVPDDEADGARALEVDFTDSRDIAVSADGSLFVSGNKGVRRIAADGTVATVVPEVREGNLIYSVDELVIGSGGDLYYSVPGRHRVMVVVRPTEVPESSGSPVLAVVLAAGAAVAVGVVLWVLRRRYHGRPSTSGPK